MRLSAEQEAVLGAVRSGRSVFFTGCAGERSGWLSQGGGRWVKSLVLAADLLLLPPPRDGEVLLAEEDRGLPPSEEHLCYSQHWGGGLSHRWHHSPCLCR